MIINKLENLLHAIFATDDKETALRDQIGAVHRLLLTVNSILKSNERQALAETVNEIKSKSLRIKFILSSLQDAERNSFVDNLLDKLKTNEPELNEDILKALISDVESWYLESTNAIGYRKSIPKKRNLLAILSIISVLSLAAYFIQYELLNPFAVQTKSVLLPHSAYVNPTSDHFTYDQEFENQLVTELWRCYFKHESCIDQFNSSIYSPNGSNVQKFIGQRYEEDIGQRYEEHKERFTDGIIFRSKIQNRSSEVIPIQKISLNVSKVNDINKSWWIKKVGNIDVSSEIEYKFDKDGILWNSTLPIVDVEIKGEFTVLDYDDGQTGKLFLSHYMPFLKDVDTTTWLSEDFSKSGKSNSFKFMAAGEADHTFKPIALIVNRSKLNTMQLEAYNKAQAKKLPFSGWHFDDTGRDREPYSPLGKDVIVLDEFKLLAAFIRVISIEKADFHISYHQLDHQMKEANFQVDSPGILFNVNDLLKYQPEPPRLLTGSENSGNALSRLFAGLGPLTEDIDAKDNIDINMHIDYRKGSSSTIHFNELLKSGGYLDLMAKIDHLSSAQYKVELVVNNDLLEFSLIDYINLRQQVWVPEDIYNTWGFKKNREEEHHWFHHILNQEKIEQKILLHKKFIETHGESNVLTERLSLSFREIDTLAVLHILDDFAQDNFKLELSEVESKDQTHVPKISIEMKSESWFDILFYICENGPYHCDYDMENKLVVVK